MNQEEMDAVRTWLAQCPSKKLCTAAAIAVSLATMVLLYDIGTEVGKFIYYISH